MKQRVAWTSANKIYKLTDYIKSLAYENERIVAVDIVKDRGILGEDSYEAVVVLEQEDTDEG